MKQLTDMEYGVLMMAIDHAKNAIAEDEFIDPYGNEDELTNELALKALESAEDKIMKNSKYFAIATLTRDDLVTDGYDISNTTDEEMDEMAEELGDMYVEHVFWQDLMYLADKMGIKQK